MRFFKRHFLHRIHKRHITPEHKNVLYGAFAQTWAFYGGNVISGIYPIIIATLSGSKITAGVFMSVLIFFQFLILDVIAGSLLDKYGVKKIGLIALALGMIFAIPFLFVQNIITATLLFLALLTRSSLFLIDPLILQNTDANEGGFWFGVKSELGSLGDLLGALSIPFFILTERWVWVGVVWIIVQGIAFILLSCVKDKKHSPKKNFLISFNIFKILKTGLHFVKVNHKYPLFVIGHTLFQGVFYGAIWFLFPLYIASQVIEGGGSLSLGIYEMVTLFIALICGIIADRIDWRILEEYAWILMIFLVWILPFYNSINALIFVGFFIGLANNFFVAAGNHALAQHDEDHEEDGQFTACSRIITNLGYALSPIIVGYLYQYISFSASLIFIAGVVTLIGIWMIGLCIKLKE